jgi:hypothetical protein
MLPTRRASAVLSAARILRLADEGTELRITACDPDRWAEIKALAPDAHIRLLGRDDGICEVFDVELGPFLVHASGPAWIPSAAELHRLYFEERLEG